MKLTKTAAINGRWQSSRWSRKRGRSIARTPAFIDRLGETAHSVDRRDRRRRVESGSSLTKDLDIDGYWEGHSRFDPFAVFGARNLRPSSVDISSGSIAEKLPSRFGNLGETLVHLEVDGSASSELLIHLTSVFPRLRHQVVVSLRSAPKQFCD